MAEGLQRTVPAGDVVLREHTGSPPLAGTVPRNPYPLAMCHPRMHSRGCVQHDAQPCVYTYMCVCVCVCVCYSILGRLLRRNSMAALGLHTPMPSASAPVPGGSPVGPGGGGVNRGDSASGATVGGPGDENGTSREDLRDVVAMRTGGCTHTHTHTCHTHTQTGTCKSAHKGMQWRQERLSVIRHVHAHACRAY